MNLGEFMMIVKQKEERIKQYDCLCGRKSNVKQMRYTRGKYYCRHCEQEMLTPREYFKKRLMLEMEEY